MPGRFVTNCKKKFRQTPPDPVLFDVMINGKTEILGLLGWPVSHTKSPVMHNALIEAYDLNLVYIPLPVHPDAVEEGVKGIPALGIKGVNVTVPHKQAVMPLLDEIDPAARAIGAVNTIQYQSKGDGSYPPKSIGYNTDWMGFRMDLEQHNIPYHGRDCVVIGGGGSARAVVYMLLEAHANIYLCVRRVVQAERIIKDMRPLFPNGRISAVALDQIEPVLRNVFNPLIVNTTPIGMYPKTDASIWPDDWPFPGGSFVYDLIYNPAETKLMAQARMAGCGALNGLGMLLGQGAEAFRIWTGINPDLSIMEQALFNR